MIRELEIRSNGYKKFTIKGLKMYVKLSGNYNIYLGIDDDKKIAINALLVSGKHNFAIDLDDNITLGEIETIFENHYNNNIKEGVKIGNIMFSM